METFQILSDQFSHFQHLFHGWLAIFCIISSYIFDLSSSPHTWGIRGRILSIVFYRFIPTYVGHTWADLLKFMSRTVHPHIRGAYVKFVGGMDEPLGSSPPTWGIRKKSWNRGFLQRFIPTYVGHTPSAVIFRCMASVHPHLRGAYSLRTYSDVHLHGSSPHTWGIHWTAVRKMAGFSHFS